MFDNEIKAKYPEHYIFSMKSTGTVRNLKGNIIFNTFFISDARTEWTTGRKEQFLKKYSSVIDRLITEAQKCGVAVKVGFKFYDYKLNYSCLNKNTWVLDVMHGYGVSSLAEYQIALAKATKCDEAPIIFVFDYPVAAYASCANERTPQRDEYSVISSYDTVDTILHELLHQFGAHDLYLPPDAYAAAQKYLPDSIMVTGSTIDSLTKYLIGWKNDIPAEGIQFLEKTKHYTISDCVRAKLERFRNPKNVIGIPTDDYGNEIKPFSSFQDMVQQAHNGNAYACFLVSYCCRFGIIVQKDVEKAIEWYLCTKDAQKHISISAYEYAKAMVTKSSLTDMEKKCMKEAFEYAISANHIWAMNDLARELMRGRILEKNEQKAMEYYIFGSIPSVSYVVMNEYKNACYYSKLIPQLYEVICDNSNRYEYSCVHGSEMAQFALAYMYRTGRLLPKDEKKAFELIRQASLSGEHQFLFELGYCYEHGLGVAENFEEAQKYYAQGEKIARQKKSTFTLEFFKKTLKREC